eukprot:m.1497248 g.1497248  ORF g.1497248 m.1497248 type:complete len:220 (+) comp25198_c0_seq9:114-773(+)
MRNNLYRQPFVRATCYAYSPSWYHNMHVGREEEKVICDNPYGSAGVAKKHHPRLQNDELSQISDNGMCLSMHQPWASLLVHGIKQHEGRSWYSAHRGRMWIAATAKPCEEESVRELEEFYKSYHGSGMLHLPTEYPSACLLGCVDVVDVLPQDDYRAAFPDGESQSPFVFVCNNPQVLTLKFPIKGQHKLWKMDKSTHDAAKVGAEPIDPGPVRAPCAP